MVAVTLQRVDTLTTKLATKEHNLHTDTLKIALSLNEITTEDAQLSDLTEVAYTNLGSRDLTSSITTENTNQAVLNLTNLSIAASGGDSEIFRYIAIYNETSTNDLLIAIGDLGNTYKIPDGNNMLLNWDNLGKIILI